MEYSGIVLDIDGTLLRGGAKALSNEDTKAIHNVVNKGIPVIIATGRTRFNSEEIVRNLHIKEPIISLYGAQVLQYKSGNVFEKTFPISSWSVEVLYEWAQKRNITTHFITSQGTVTYGNERLENLTPYLNTDFCYNNHKILQIVFSNDNKLIYFSLMKLMQKEKIDCISYFRGKDIVCLSKETNKGIALKFLALQENWDLNSFIGIGDDLTDVPVFKEVGLSIGIGNNPEIEKYVRRNFPSDVPDLIAKCIYECFKL